MTERCERPCGSIRCESYGFAGRPTCTSPDPSSRLEEIRARHARTTPRYYDDVGWLLEHVEQLRSELEVEATTGFDAGRRKAQGERHAWEAQRQAVLNLCDKATTRSRGRGGLELLVPVGAVRKILGAP